MGNMERAKRKTIIGLSVLLFFAAVIASTALIGRTGVACAAPEDNDLSVVQASKIVYCGENYISSTSLKNELLSAFLFTLNGSIFDANCENTDIFCSMDVCAPGTYNCVFTLHDGAKTYSSGSVDVVVSKRVVTVSVLLNGKLNLTVKEGDDISVLFDYAGGTEQDTQILTSSGVQYRMLNDDVLSYQAYVDALPRDVVENAMVVASHARSDYYDFIYAESRLTIEESLVPSLSLNNAAGRTIVSLTGSFSAISTIQYNEIGVSSANTEYVGRLNSAKQVYLGQKLFDQNDVIACYDISVLKNDELPSGNTQATVRLAIASSLKGKKSYQVVALYNNGTTDVVNASITADGYLLFNVADMGTFLLITPTQGISTTWYIVAVIAGGTVIILVILFASLFRRKY